MSTHLPPAADVGTEPWRDPARPAAERAADLLTRMTLEEKLAQLASVWLADPPAGAGADPADGGGSGEVAPLQGEFTDGMPPLADLIRDGLGQITRMFGTRPVTPAAGASALAALQARISRASRFGIPAIAHEECLTGFMTWGATSFPVPLAWGASFDPALVEQMARAIGRGMRAAGVHQGLAPVLDVAHDARWGRVEETIGEDPYLVGLVGAGYVRGLQAAGVLATVKHFAGYSVSRAGRNMAPVSIGPRELADVFLLPFEMAIREGGARSVMASYAGLDGVPAHADRVLLTDVLRHQLGFDGVVVADYFGISFLEFLHGVAASAGDAGAIALRAGVDVELPNVRCYGAPLAAEVRSGRVPEELVDRSAGRVLRQKIELGLLDPPGDGPVGGAGLDLDPPENRALARRLAEESVVLLANAGGVLPLDRPARLAVVGPLAGDPLAFLGGYTFPRHVLGEERRQVAGQPATAAPGPARRPLTLVEAVRAEFPGARIDHAAGCGVSEPDRSGFAEAAGLARAADAVVAVLGDESGHFGRGTSGEGCDTGDLRLPGVQAGLLDELVATGAPVVCVLVTGRPYAIGPVAGRLAAAVQAFFPGQEGGSAIAGVLSGRVVPSGKLPVQLPVSAGSQPAPYLGPRLAGPTRVSSVDPTPLFPFGHGLSYTTFEYSGLVISPAMITTSGSCEIGCTVRNTGSRAGDEVVQLYLRDPVAQVDRPVRSLAGFARVSLRPAEARRVTFRLHADRTSFTGLDGTLLVEPGRIDVAVGASSADLRLRGDLELRGPQRTVGPERVLTTPVVVSGV